MSSRQNNVIIGASLVLAIWLVSSTAFKSSTAIHVDADSGSRGKPASSPWARRLDEYDEWFEDYCWRCGDDRLCIVMCVGNDISLFMCDRHGWASWNRPVENLNGFINKLPSPSDIFTSPLNPNMPLWKYLILAAPLGGLYYLIDQVQKGYVPEPVLTAIERISDNVSDGQSIYIFFKDGLKSFGFFSTGLYFFGSTASYFASKWASNEKFSLTTLILHWTSLIHIVHAQHALRFRVPVGTQFIVDFTEFVLEAAPQSQVQGVASYIKDEKDKYSSLFGTISDSFYLQLSTIWNIYTLSRNFKTLSAPPFTEHVEGRYDFLKLFVDSTVRVLGYAIFGSGMRPSGLDANDNNYALWGFVLLGFVHSAIAVGAHVTTNVGQFLGYSFTCFVCSPPLVFRLPDEVRLAIMRSRVVEMTLMFMYVNGVHGVQGAEQIFKMPLITLMFLTSFLAYAVFTFPEAKVMYGQMLIVFGIMLLFNLALMIIVVIVVLWDMFWCWLFVIVIEFPIFFVLFLCACCLAIVVSLLIFGLWIGTLGVAYHLGLRLPDWEEMFQNLTDAFWEPEYGTERWKIPVRPISFERSLLLFAILMEVWLLSSIFLRNHGCCKHGFWKYGPWRQEDTRGQTSMEDDASEKDPPDSEQGPASQQDSPEVAHSHRRKTGTEDDAYVPLRLSLEEEEHFVDSEQDPASEQGVLTRLRRKAKDVKDIAGDVAPQCPIFGAIAENHLDLVVFLLTVTPMARMKLKRQRPFEWACTKPSFDPEVFRKYFEQRIDEDYNLSVINDPVNVFLEAGVVWIYRRDFTQASVTNEFRKEDLDVLGDFISQMVQKGKRDVVERFYQEASRECKPDLQLKMEGIPHYEEITLLMFMANGEEQEKGRFLRWAKEQSDVDESRVTVFRERFKQHLKKNEELYIHMYMESGIAELCFRESAAEEEAFADLIDFLPHMKIATELARARQGGVPQKKSMSTKALQEKVLPLKLGKPEIEFLMEFGADASIALEVPFEAENVDAVQALLDCKASANAKGADGEPLLARAIKSDANLELVQRFLNANANADTKDRQGEPVLARAIKTNANVELVKKLLNANADANAKDVQKEPLLAHVIHNKELVKSFLDANADANTKDRQGEPVLAHAIKTNVNIDIVENLLNANADANAKDLQKEPLLAHVIHNKELVKSFLDAKADASTTDRQGEPLLARIMIDANVDLITTILKAKDDANLKGHLLASAIENNQNIMAKKLVDVKAALPSTFNCTSFLVNAARKNDEADKEYLRMILPALDVNMQQEALIKCSYEGVSALVRAGLRPTDDTISRCGLFDREKKKLLKEYKDRKI